MNKLSRNTVDMLIPTKHGWLVLYVSQTDHLVDEDSGDLLFDRF